MTSGQSPTKVIFRTTLTRMITQHKLQKPFKFIIVFNLAVTQYLKNGIFTIQIPDFATTHINTCTWVLQIKRKESKEDSKAKYYNTENPKSMSHRGSQNDSNFIWMLFKAM